MNLEAWLDSPLIIIILFLASLLFISLSLNIWSFLRICHLRKEMKKKDEDLHSSEIHQITLKEKIRFLEIFNQEQEKSQKNLMESFKALSLDALKSNSASFLDLATTKLSTFEEGAKKDLNERQKSMDELLKPIRESLTKANDLHLELQKNLNTTHVSISEQVKSLVSLQNKLQGETQNLVKALRTPNVRGRWGEIQLKRVVEIAGMLEHCDFIQQPQGEEERKLRPDMVINLPQGKKIIVDSKAPLQAYLESIESKTEEESLHYLKEHARQVKVHIKQLSSKSYWDQFDHTPEFVVLFLPGETFFSAALQTDPHLIEYAVQEKVILATPTTLIALLKSVSYGWRQELIEKNALELSALGKLVYERIQILANHFVDLGRGIEKTVESFNKTVGSFNARVLPSLKKLKETGVSSLGPIEPIENVEDFPKIPNDEKVSLS